MKALPVIKTTGFTLIVTTRIKSNAVEYSGVKYSTNFCS